MARPERKNVDYFPHYMNHGAKMKYLERKYGNDGYATWYKIMERLASSENHHINLQDDIQLTFLADYCGIEEHILVEIIEFLVRVKWLHTKLWNHKVLYSPTFIDSIQDAYKRRNNECINTHTVELMYYNNPQSEGLMYDNNTQSKVKDIKENKSKLKKSIVLPFSSAEFFKFWNIWKDYKKAEFGFKYKSEISEQAAAKKLGNMAGGDEQTAIAIINQSLENGWKGFFKIDKKENGQTNYQDLRQKASKMFGN